ncbi:MAG: alkaline phosphatase family protein [Flavobacteriaceae bacterium]|nr:alkaline phosphatase family protein [Flavobacteriaceae bacterium]
MKTKQLASYLRFSLFLGLVIMISCNSKDGNKQPKGISHIVVIGIDGMSPDGIANAHTPMMDSMVANGASSFATRAVLPTSSGPNWGSMIMGADVEQHGITENSWEQTKYVLPAVVSVRNNLFPSIFDLIRDQKPNAKTAAIYDWGTFGRYVNEAVVDINIDGDKEDGTTDAVVNTILEHQPDFTFVHIDHVDHAGHDHSHGSQAYYDAVAKADLLITRIVEATKEAGIYEKTMFIISSDHGGRGYSHGGATLGQIEVPFILYGAGIKKGYTIKEAVYQYDNPATVAFAMGLQTPQAWIGRPIKSVFVGQAEPTLKYTPNYFYAPNILPTNNTFTQAGGIFKNKAQVVIKNNNKQGEIYYTLDGSDVSLENGIRYQKPFDIQQTTVVKAQIFVNEKPMGNSNTAYFRIYDPNNTKLGVNYKVYAAKQLPLLHHLPKDSLLYQGKHIEFSVEPILPQWERQREIVVLFESELQIDQAGEYTFYTTSEEESMLYVDGHLVVNNNGKYNLLERSGNIPLKAGKHKIQLAYYNEGSFAHIEAAYQGPQLPKQIIPTNKLYKLQ